MASLRELRDIRLEKLNTLEKMGVKPYPAKSNRDTKTSAIKTNFADYEGKEVVVAGRMMSFREHGQLSFADVQDETGRIQLYIKAENLATTKLSTTNDKFPFDALNLLDIGDHVEGRGIVTKTKRGEISIEVSELRLLAKSIRPLPEKWSGLTDVERRYRRRYLDMTINPEVRDTLKKKGYFIQHMRDFMINEGFSEVETPILESITGGAEASPFITHHNSLNIDMYLRISLELPLKRLVAGGMEKVFEIGRVFRNEGMSMMHLQHYTQMEFYWAYADFEMLVDFIERLYAYSIEKTFGTLKLNWQGTDLDFTPPWPRIDYQVEFLEKNGIDLSKEVSLEELVKRAKEVGVEDIENADKGRLIDSIYKKTIRPKIIQPSLLVNHPVIISPLSKRDDDNPNIVKRFQPVMLGAELGNGWNELNDPIDQFGRFKEQQKLLEDGDDEAMMMDIDYVEALEYGMPPTAGFGVGIDRLFMYLADLPSIRDTLFFPIMRPRVSSVSQEIYGLDVHIYKDIEDNSFISIDENLSTLDDTYAVTVAKLKIHQLKPDSEDLSDLRTRAVNKFIRAEVDFGNNTRIKAYRKMFENMGLDPEVDVPYAERLLKYALENKEFKEMGLVLDLANISTISHGVSVSVVDAKKVSGAIVIKRAEQDYKYLDVHGDTQHIKEGVLCYFDNDGPIRSNLNMYTADRVKVEEHTSEVLIFVDKIEEIDQELAERVMRHFISDINNFGNVAVQRIGVVRMREVDSTIDPLVLDGIPDGDLVNIDEDVKQNLKLSTGFMDFEIEDNKDIDLSSFKKMINEMVKQRYNSTSEIKQSKIISSFREVYKKFGVDPNKKLNSTEALIRRIVSGKGLYNINPVVDIYNATSAELELPMAAYDLNSIEGKITLRFARGGDTIKKIGDDQSTQVKEGELVYADDEGVVCLDYNYRDSDRTKITNNTTRFIVIIDATEEVKVEQINDAMITLASRMKELLGAKVISKGIV